MGKKKFLEKLVFVKWKVIYEDKEIISLAQNFSDETDYNPEQANGIMVIPKACISEIISFSFSQLLELEQK